MPKRALQAILNMPKFTLLTRWIMAWSPTNKTFYDTMLTGGLIMEKMAQIHYRVPLKQKKIMDDYTKLHHITESKFLRKVFSDKMLEVKADLMSRKFGKKLAKEPINKEIHDEQSFEKWLFQK